MFSFCTDPDAIAGARWLACYLTTPKHANFYVSFITVISLVLISAPVILLLGFMGALARRSAAAPLRWMGQIYTSSVRGIPDIIFFLFVPFALDMGVEYVRHRIKCPDWTEPVRQGNDFVVCAAAKMPLGPSPEWVHDSWGFFLALIAYAIVFGAFAANIIDGALSAVPRQQLETAQAYGMTRRQTFRRIQLPQMWAYALPGLSNLWMILIKATPLLFLLGIEDIVFWARELGSSKTQIYAYPHPDWRVWYFGALLLFYLAFTFVSEKVFARITRRVSRGMATAGGSTGGRATAGGAAS